MQLQELIEYFEQIMPLALAENWDNVGLILGDRTRAIKSVMTCLTIDEAVVEEAIHTHVDCIVSHHPFPFHASKRWTADTPDGRIMLGLLGAQIAVYSPHTAYDSAFFGINRQLAEGLGLQDVEPLYPGRLDATEAMLDGLDASDHASVALDLKRQPRAKQGEQSAKPLLGTGRIGRFATPKSFAELTEQVKDMLQISALPVVGDPEKSIARVAIGCGAADDFIAQAQSRGADALLLGEARFHACLEARARDVALLLAGHYSTERFALCILADRIARKFKGLTVRASAKESDPIRMA